MKALFRQAVDAASKTYGEPATYWPADGSAETEVRVIARRPDQRLDWAGQTSVHSRTAIFDVRASEVAQPCAGAVLTYAGADYVIQGEPRTEDPHRLVWTLDTRPK